MPCVDALNVLPDQFVAYRELPSHRLHLKYLPELPQNIFPYVRYRTEHRERNWDSEAGVTSALVPVDPVSNWNRPNRGSQIRKAYYQRFMP
jgi:hypothetical protein